MYDGYGIEESFYGVVGQVMEGERYKKSPEIVDQYMKDRAPFEAPAAYIVFKRWDELCTDDEPAVVIFFAAPFKKFARMVNNAEASFLITGSWSKVKKRIQAGA